MISYRLNLLLVIIAAAGIASRVAGRCNSVCGGRTLPYPFGFSRSCPIRFKCSGGVAKIGEFSVQNVTQSSVFVAVPPDCHRSVSRLKPLFGELHAPTLDNSLLGENCKGLLEDGCSLMEKFLGSQGRFRSCGSIGNFSCFSVDVTNPSRFISFQNLTLRSCSSLLSAIAFEQFSGRSPIAFEFGVLQLGWWLKGRCSNGTCSEGAKCVDVGLADGNQGHRCSCPEGYFGDGFANGIPCQEVHSSEQPHCHGCGILEGHCKGTKVGFLIGGAFAGSCLVAVMAVSLFFIRRRSIASRNVSSAKRLLSEAAGNPSITFYSFKEIEKATNGFSDNQRLGTGAYGTVYAGKLNNEWVAIKRLRYRDSESIDQVMNEIRLISSVSHPNLVRLLGCCIERGEPVLVYEFMPNGTLSQHLQRERGNGLPWSVRLTIAAQTARAVAYLHSAMKPPIYHRDIKSSNILLDDNCNSKVADFGLSRMGMTESSHISTAPQGTPGYLDPQYHQCFHLSDKSDVYSFGVVLAEIITALKVVDFNRPHSEINLAALAIDTIGSGCIDKIVDPVLAENLDSWELLSVHRVAELAFRCLSFHRDMRPTMVEAADELEQIQISTRFPHTGEDSPSVSKGSSDFGSNRSENSREGSKSVVAPQKPHDCAVATDEVRGNSPVSSVQESSLSDLSPRPSNALLSNMPR